MIRKRRWLWVLLFILVAVLLGALATGWNVVLVRDYQHLLELVRNVSLPNPPAIESSSLILKMFLGTLGFVIALTLTVLLFTKLLNEMRLNQLQSEFLATVSHELKTPLASLTLSSSLLRAGDLKAVDAHQLWSSHEIELNRLKDQVETLLEAARWQNKPHLKERTKIDLEEWIHESWISWKSILGPSSTLVRTGTKFPYPTDVNLRALNLIVNNILSNSAKFAKDYPHVTIHTEQFFTSQFFTPPRWSISFQDQGWGFPPEDARKIFQRFYRSKTGAKHAIPGTGLGLYLAYSASKAARLHLSAQSTEIGSGATFIIEGKWKR